MKGQLGKKILGIRKQKKSKKKLKNEQKTFHQRSFMEQDLILRQRIVDSVDSTYISVDRIDHRNNLPNGAPSLRHYLVAITVNNNDL